MITSLGFNSKVRPHRYKKARCAIRNVSKKDLSKIIMEFENLPYEIYEKKMPKHKPTNIYFYLSRQLVKCMMRADARNFHGYPVRTEMTDLSLQIFSTDEDESKGIIVHENLSQSCSKDEDESKGIIANKTLSQSCSMDEDELCSMKEEKPE